jgi:hypothetical protein
MATEKSPAKGRFVANLAPPPPGEDLRHLIAELRRDGRPAWRLGPIIAPKIEYAADRDPETGEPILYRPWAIDQAFFRPQVLLWLETYHAGVYRQFSRQDRVQTWKIAAAAMRDLHACSYDEIADNFRYVDVRTARRRVAEGRELWFRLCAWPWCYWEPNGRPPASWREQGADATLAASFQTWATGVPILPAASAECQSA